MNLIETLNVDGLKISFYSGIDFDMAINHPKDGSDGHKFFFIESWRVEVKSWERQKKIDSILGSSEVKKFSSKLLENDFVSIYQLEGTESSVIYKHVREKVLRGELINQTWLPFSGIDKGAWKVEKIRVSN